MITSVTGVTRSGGTDLPTPAVRTATASREASSGGRSPASAAGSAGPTDAAGAPGIRRHREAGSCGAARGGVPAGRRRGHGGSGHEPLPRRAADGAGHRRRSPHGASIADHPGAALVPDLLPGDRPGPGRDVDGVGDRGRGDVEAGLGVGRRHRLRDRQHHDEGPRAAARGPSSWSWCGLVPATARVGKSPGGGGGVWGAPQARAAKPSPARGAGGAAGASSAAAVCAAAVGLAAAWAATAAK